MIATLSQIWRRRTTARLTGTSANPCGSIWWSRVFVPRRTTLKPTFFRRRSVMHSAAGNCRTAWPRSLCAWLPGWRIARAPSAPCMKPGGPPLCAVAGFGLRLVFVEIGDPCSARRPSAASTAAIFCATISAFFTSPPANPGQQGILQQVARRPYVPQFRAGSRRQRADARRRATKARCDPSYAARRCFSLRNAKVGLDVARGPN
jgi:hypothetical protein